MSLFKVLVASLAPFFNCFKEAHWLTISIIESAISPFANGWAL